MVKYRLKISIDLKEEEKARIIYNSISPDLVSNIAKEDVADLNLDGKALNVDFQSHSYSRFRGFINTLLRLIFISEKVIELVRRDEP